MFKKGGLAFKPKLPSTRPRPQAVSAPTLTDKHAENRPAAEDEADAAPISAAETPADEPALEVASLEETVPIYGGNSVKDLVNSESRGTESNKRTTQPQPSTAIPPNRATPASFDSLEVSRESISLTKDPTANHDRPQDQSEVSAPAIRHVSETRGSVSSPERHPQPSTTREYETPSTHETRLPEESSSLTVEESASQAVALAQQRKGPRRSKKPPEVEVKTAEAEVEATQPKKRRRIASQQTTSTTRTVSCSNSTGLKKEGVRRSRRACSETPEDAESKVVDLQQLKMADLTKDLKIGKKFSRHDELRDRERKARVKTKRGSQDVNGSAAPDATSASADGPDKQSRSPGSQSTPTAGAATGPQFRIVDGQIVIDQSSLVMDRHARAAAAQAGEDLETIEENDFTRLTTSNSYMSGSKLKGPNVWTEEETELFYRGLRMFGTDFEMISKMYRGKQRRHVKLKFNREERLNPSGIDAALIGEKTIKMDIGEYKAFTGADYEPVERIEAEQRQIEETYEAERQRVAEEQAEVMRKKREELFVDEAAADEANGKRKKGKRKGKEAVAYWLNGEPIAQAS